MRATLDHPLFGTGLIKLDAGYDRISLLQDRILTDEGFDAPGNIGTGKRAFVALAVDAPLDRLGIKGGRLKLNGQLQRTRVDGPDFGRARAASPASIPNGNGAPNSRRDIGKFAYGTTISDRDRFAFFRADEVDTNYNGGIYGTAFVEYRPSERTTVTFDVDNLFNTKGLRNRLFSFPNRSNPDPLAQRIPRAQLAPRLRADAQAHLRRHDQVPSPQRLADGVLILRPLVEKALSYTPLACHASGAPSVAAGSLRLSIVRPHDGHPPNPRKWSLSRRL